jgi:hypothetical protein
MSATAGTPLLQHLAQLAADHDAARVASKTADIACKHEGAAEAFRLAADLLTTAIAVLVRAHSLAADPGYRQGLAWAHSLLSKETI